MQKAAGVLQIQFRNVFGDLWHNSEYCHGFNVIKQGSEPATFSGRQQKVFGLCGSHQRPFRGAELMLVSCEHKGQN